MYLRSFSLVTLTGPGLALKGAMIPNHSVLERSTSVIGEAENALYCVTDDVTCCGTPPSPGDGGSGNGRGHWYYRDRTDPYSSATTIPISPFYASWLTGAVLLNYRAPGGARGLFRCEILDSRSTLHQLYTCIYSSTLTTDCKFPAFTQYTQW